MAAMRLGISLLCVIFVGTLVAAQGYPPGDTSSNYIRYNGSGCPPGSVTVFFPPNASYYLVEFRKLSVEVGPNIDFASARTACNVTHGLKVPPGYRWVLSAGYTTGNNLEIQKSATAEYYAEIYFEGVVDKVRQRL
jgi:hypothetical protein